ncbi:MAG: hypothetical protein JRJ31_13780 [Deltaproteobacteria bacterium]|nr:hypothetical protein [Deltaproteobacteria bacterium]
MWKGGDIMVTVMVAGISIILMAAAPTTTRAIDAGGDASARKKHAHVKVRGHI